MAKHLWWYRTVLFTPQPRQNPDKWEAFFDALPEHFWGWRQQVYGTLGVSSHSGVVHVSCWPRWVPKRWAMRQVAKVALRCNLAGDAAFTTELYVDANAPDDVDTRLHFEHIKGIWEARDDGTIPDFVRVHTHDQNPKIAEQVFGPVDQATINRIHAEDAKEDENV